MMRHSTWIVLLCLTGVVSAQQAQDPREEMKKRMEEIARLMRESERLLLEITRVDQLVAQRRRNVEELEKLEQPRQPQADQTAQDAQQKKIEELQQQQQETARKLSELFDGQRERGVQTVKQLEALLQNWPRQQGQGKGQPDQNKPQSKAEKEREKRLREQQEKKQRDQQPNSPREKKDQQNKPQTGNRKPPDQQQASRAVRAIEAWIASLPPKQQERISRGDLSDIPPRYRRLVREYTALRAKREAERESDD